jgi:hypothetical protein
MYTLICGHMTVQAKKPMPDQEKTCDLMNHWLRAPPPDMHCPTDQLAACWQAASPLLTTLHGPPPGDTRCSTALRECCCYKQPQNGTIPPPCGVHDHHATEWHDEHETGPIKQTRQTSTKCCDKTIKHLIVSAHGPHAHERPDMTAHRGADPGAHSMRAADSAMAVNGYQSSACRKHRTWRPYSLSTSAA